MEWLYVTTGFEAQAWMEGLEDVWRGIGGRRIVIMRGDFRSKNTSGLPAKSAAGIDTFRDFEDRFAQWHTCASLNAVLIRPDRYVYGTAKGSAELAENFTRLIIQLKD